MGIIKTIVAAAMALTASATASRAEPAIETTGPGWMLEVGAIYLHRANTSSDLLVLAGQPLSTVDGGVVDNLNTVGGVVTLTGSLWDVGVQFRAIATAKAKDKSAGQFDGVNFMLFGARADGNSRGIFATFLFNGDYSIEREASFYSVEANVDLFEHNGIRLFAGPRALLIEDDLAINLNVNRSAAGVFTDAFTQVDNRMAGLQIGADATYRLASHDRLSFGATAKVAALANSARARFGITSSPTLGGGDERSSKSDRRFSALGELELRANYAVSANFDISLAYNLIAISNVATSVETFFASGIERTGSRALTNIADRSAIYHGISLKGVVRF